MVHITESNDQINNTEFYNMFADVLAWRAIQLIERIDEATKDAANSSLVFYEDD